MKAEEYDQWYESPRGRWIGQREVALLLEALQPRPDESVLDVGCGTGYFTRALALALDGPVTGVDVNVEWVEYARRRGPSTISYEVADARALPYGDCSFDLVVSIAAVCFIEDESAAVREMVRVARRRVAIGLLNRHSLLWICKGRKGGSGGYRGARWHTVNEAKRLFQDMPVQRIRAHTAVNIPSGGRFAKTIEHVIPQRLHLGAFILVIADIEHPTVHATGPSRD